MTNFYCWDAQINLCRDVTYNVSTQNLTILGEIQGKVIFAVKEQK
jgi:hypothetical protein